MTSINLHNNKNSAVAQWLYTLTIYLIFAHFGFKARQRKLLFCWYRVLFLSLSLYWNWLPQTHGLCNNYRQFVLVRTPSSLSSAKDITWSVRMKFWSLEVEKTEPYIYERIKIKLTTEKRLTRPVLTLLSIRN